MKYKLVRLDGTSKVDELVGHAEIKRIDEVMEVESRNGRATEIMYFYTNEKDEDGIRIYKERIEKELRKERK